MPQTATAPKSTTAQLYRPILGDLEQAERIFAAELASDIPYIRELVAHLGHYRGKRLRPALLFLVAKACGEVRREHHILAAVVEMIHTATLVHDDVLDDAEIRRHVATINRRWNNSASVLLGDLLFTHAFYLASTTGSTLACRLIGEATNRVCAGELQQIGERGNIDLDEARYFEIIRGKTAELTACAARLGAIFAGADESTVEALAQFGRDLGMAFQIADDVLDVTGQETLAGKSLGTDLEQQKMTLPLIRLVQHAEPEQARQLRHILASPENHKREQLTPYLAASDAVAYATHVAARYATNARQALHSLPPSECRQILDDLTHLVVHRNH
jgi:octaprenyl-diphosphate synthase